MTPDEFRTAGYRLIDWIADYRDQLARLPVMARTEPGAIRAQLPPSAPEEAEGIEAMVEDLERILLPGLTHWQHPSFFGYFPAIASPSSVLGDLLSTGLGQIGLSWQASPALTELEEVVLNWMRQAVGLSDSWRGVIQDTASTSTLVALTCARERSSGFAMDRGGLQEQPRPLVVYASEQAHSSVLKAALLAGFGREHVRSIPVDDAFALDANQLAIAVREDREAGLLPCAIVATTGTTASTALDPVGLIARGTADAGLWLHVDAAMAGSAMILPECRWMWEGIESADSIVLNAHKWLGAAFDCSLYYVKDPQHLVRVMSTNPSYLRTSTDDRAVNFRDWGIPLGRRFRALKLWALLRVEGLDAIRSRLRRDMELARWLADRARSASNWRVLAPVPLQTVCLRHEPPGLEGEALDRHTLGLIDRINRSGAAYLTPAILDGRWMVRVSIGAEPTGLEHVEALWGLMRREAESAG